MALFARLRKIARASRPDPTAHHEHTQTPENSGLAHEQIEAGLKALTALGLHHKEKQLTRDDCMLLLYTVGLNPTYDLLDSKLKTFHLQHHRHITFGQVTHVWASMLSDVGEEEAMLKRAFQFFDRDGSGGIEVSELITVMKELGDLMSEKEIRDFVAIADIDKDGILSYEEFMQQLKHDHGMGPRELQDRNAGLRESLHASPSSSAQLPPSGQAGAKQAAGRPPRSSVGSSLSSVAAQRVSDVDAGDVHIIFTEFNVPLVLQRGYRRSS